MRVLVTGAAGMLGRDLVTHLADRHEVTAVDLDVDVTDPAAVRSCVAGCRPEAVFHLAAWTDVDAAEAHEDEAAAVNGEGAGIVAAAASSAGAAVVLPSTDYVFDGSKGAPYDEDDAPRPSAPTAAPSSPASGPRSRAIPAEPGGAHRAGSTGPAGATSSTRCGAWGPSGTRWRSSTTRPDRRPGPATSPPRWRRCSTGRPASTTRPAPGRVTWAGLAQAVFEETGCPCRVRPVTTEAIGRPAPRPRYSALVTARPGAPRLRDWREALADYLEESA